MKAIGYVRVSTEEQTNGISLDAQEAKIRAWCTLHDAELVSLRCGVLCLHRPYLHVTARCPAGRCSLWP